MVIEFPVSNLFEVNNRPWSAPWPIVYDTSVGDFRLPNLFPSYKVVLSDWEVTWDDGPALTSIMRRYWWLSWAACAVYLVCVFGGQRVMSRRDAFDLRVPLALWNLALAVFSVIGSLRVLPHLLYGVYENPLTYFICRVPAASYSHGAPGFWVLVFMWSKYAELLDTAFLVLRKKPVNFLHWYHHVTVLLYCWHAGQIEIPTGIFFAAMNYVVHSVMYFYYLLAAVGKPPKWGFAVTVLQISQMFAGILITGLHIGAMYSSYAVPNCNGSWTNLQAAFFMYFSYALLFLQFFVNRYLYPRSMPALKKKAE